MNHTPNFDNPTLQDIEEAVISMFDQCCKIIVRENIPDPEYNVCEKTIKYTLDYLRMKREDAKNIETEDLPY